MIYKTQFFSMKVRYARTDRRYLQCLRHCYSPGLVRYTGRLLALQLHGNPCYGSLISWFSTRQPRNCNLITRWFAFERNHHCRPVNEHTCAIIFFKKKWTLATLKTQLNNSRYPMNFLNLKESKAVSITIRLKSTSRIKILHREILNASGV